MLRYFYSTPRSSKCYPISTTGRSIDLMQRTTHNAKHHAAVTRVYNVSETKHAEGIVHGIWVFLKLTLCKGWIWQSKNWSCRDKRADWKPTLKRYLFQNMPQERVFNLHHTFDIWHLKVNFEIIKDLAESIQKATRLQRIWCTEHQLLHADVVTGWPESWREAYSERTRTQRELITFSFLL